MVGIIADQDSYSYVADTKITFIDIISLNILLSFKLVC